MELFQPNTLVCIKSSNLLWALRGCHRQCVSWMGKLKQGKKKASCTAEIIMPVSKVSAPFCDFQSFTEHEVDGGEKPCLSHF